MTSTKMEDNLKKREQIEDDLNKFILEDDLKKWKMTSSTI